MVQLTIALLVAIVGTAIADTEKCDWERLGVFLLLAVPSIIISMVLWLPASVDPKRELSTPVCVDIVQLKTARGGISGGGSFLGWSVSGGTPYYVVMEKENGKMIRRFLKQDNTYIIETNEKPRVEYPSYIKSYSKWFAAPWLINKKEEVFWRLNATVYVPKGTVALKFNEI
jgi:hypothetical protein